MIGLAKKGSGKLSCTLPKGNQARRKPMPVTTKEAKTLLKLIDQVAAKEGTTLQFALRDVLTDLRHIAQVLPLDFEGAIAGSEQVYSEESLDPC